TSSHFFATCSKVIDLLNRSSIPSSSRERKTSSTRCLASLLVFPLLSICLLFPVTGLRGPSAMHLQLTFPDFNVILSQNIFYTSFSNSMLTLFHFDFKNYILY